MADDPQPPRPSDPPRGTLSGAPPPPPRADSTRAAPSKNTVTPNLPREPVRALTDSLTTGILLKHGRAPLRFQAQAAESYFVTVQTDRGERTLWSRGLERALVESRTQPQLGDAVGIRENGVDPVTFITRERNSAGQVMVEKRLDTPRGHWLVEKREFFDERAVAAQVLRDPRISRREAVRNHPELEGAYWALDSAAKTADLRISNPTSRERFVSLMREALAHAAERGAPLPAPRSSNRTEKQARGGRIEGEAEPTR